MTSSKTVLALVLVTATCGSCSKKSDEASSNAARQAAAAPTPAPSAEPATTAPAEVTEPPSGTISTDPTPVPVCPKTGDGIANVSWAAKGTKAVEVRVDAPDGKLFAQTGPTGSAKTGHWVRKGTVFYLQNAATGAPLAATSTLAKLEVEVVPGSCP
jgi:hypothetical protein